MGLKSTFITFLGLVALVVIGAVAGDAVAAEHSVLGEFFTQPL
jgi:hypothetical protein